MTDEERIGPHFVRVVGDTVLTRYVGEPRLEDVRAIHQRLDRALAEHGRLFVINDLRRSGIPSAETRRWIAEWARSHPVAGQVNFGASMPVRAILGLLVRGAVLLGARTPTHPVHVAGEAEAFAWVDERRRQLG